MGQRDAVEAVMRTAAGDATWLTLWDIQARLEKNYSTQSISARLRDFRKARYGGHIVRRKQRSRGVYEYLVEFRNAVATPEAA